MERSLTKTLGHKNKISVNKVWNRYRATWPTTTGPRRGLQVTVQAEPGKTAAGGPMGWHLGGPQNHEGHPQRRASGNLE